MAEQNKNELILEPTKISVKDLDFDNLDDDELTAIRDEINVMLQINQLKIDRMGFIKKQILEEKIQLKIQMEKEIEKNREKIIRQIKKEIEEEQEEEDDDDTESEIVESTIYNKKSPKGKVTKPRGRPPAKKK